MQVSEKRLAANRANALKSTGPRTEAGKRRSSQNGYKHHLYSRKFRMPDAWEQWAFRRAEEFIKDIDDPELRPLMFYRVYVNGRQKYLTHLLVAYFRLVEKNGMNWFFANCSYLNALHRYSGNLSSEIRRASRLLRIYYDRSRQQHDLPTVPKQKVLAVGQTISAPRPTEPISPGPANVRERVSTPAPRPIKPIDRVSISTPRPTEAIFPRPPPANQHSDKVLSSPEPPRVHLQ